MQCSSIQSIYSYMLYKCIICVQYWMKHMQYNMTGSMERMCMYKAIVWVTVCCVDGATVQYEAQGRREWGGLEIRLAVLPNSCNCKRGLQETATKHPPPLSLPPSLDPSLSPASYSSPGTRTSGAAAVWPCGSRSPSTASPPPQETAS